jgi:hypothetical protein
MEAQRNLDNDPFNDVEEAIQLITETRNIYMAVQEIMIILHGKVESRVAVAQHSGVLNELKKIRDGENFTRVWIPHDEEGGKELFQWYWKYRAMLRELHFSFCALMSADKIIKEHVGGNPGPNIGETYNLYDYLDVKGSQSIESSEEEYSSEEAFYLKITRILSSRIFVQQ